MIMPSPVSAQYKTTDQIISETLIKTTTSGCEEAHKNSKFKLKVQHVANTAMQHGRLLQLMDKPKSCLNCNSSRVSCCPASVLLSSVGNVQPGYWI